jgi:Ca2+-binding RTX toxin-like protein
MITENFADRGKTFITGVIYNDTKVNDNFFTVGEQKAGRSVTSAGATTDTTGAGGGYELAYATAGTKVVNFNVSTGRVTVSVTLGSSNVKVDVVNGDEVWTNANLRVTTTNVDEIHALGISKLSLTGSAASELLFGNKGINTLDGGSGNDTLRGEAGADVMIGGRGRDTHTGGSSADKFVFRSVSESGATSTSRDTINDFQDSGSDKIDLHLVFAGTLRYRGTAAFTDDGQVRVQKSGTSDVLVSVSTDADSTAELTILLKGTTTAQMSSTDFIL